MNASIPHHVSHTYPNEPPDIGTTQIDDPFPTALPATFLQTLISNTSFSPIPNTQLSIQTTIDLSDESTTSDKDEDIFIPLTTNGKFRLYSTWKFSVIIKVFGK